MTRKRAQRSVSTSTRRKKHIQSQKRQRVHFRLSHSWWDKLHTVQIQIDCICLAITVIITIASHLSLCFGSSTEELLGKRVSFLFFCCWEIGKSLERLWGDKSLDLNCVSAAGMNKTLQCLGDTSCIVFISNNMRSGTTESNSHPNVLEYFWVWRCWLLWNYCHETFR